MLTSFVYKRNYSISIPIIIPSGFGDIVQSSGFVQDALVMFNRTIPRKGIRVDWETQHSKGAGTIWSLRMDVSKILVELTMDSSNVSAPEIRMNGTKKTKKSDGSLIDLKIERLYVVGAGGMEITLYSIYETRTGN